MTNGLRDRPGRAGVRRAVQLGHVTPMFQPIEDLQTGTCRGFEALARVAHDESLLTPDVFLPLLDDDDRLALFGTMLGNSIALIRALGAAGASLYVSINVEISLVASEPFFDVLQYFLERYDFSGENLVLEILENEDIRDLGRLRTCLSAVKALGLSLALDDIGTGYASLTRMRELPIDMFKLDRGFGIGLEQRPDELVFVMSMLALSRGIGKTLVVEGIETPEVYDAMRMLGVAAGQGYGIARPMPAAQVASWLATSATRAPEPVPVCLLGAYASHLTVVEACRNLRAQPLPFVWLREAMQDHETCVVGRLFGARGWHDTAVGAAHRAFHAALGDFTADPTRWEDGAERFRTAMVDAMDADPAATGCLPREGMPACACEPRRTARRPRRVGAR